MNEQVRQQTWEAVHQSVGAFLELTGRKANDLRTEIALMLEELRPDIEHHLARSLAGSDISHQSLLLIGDAVVSRTARLVLMTSMRERLALAAVIQAVLRTALMLAR